MAWAGCTVVSAATKALSVELKAVLLENPIAHETQVNQWHRATLCNRIFLFRRLQFGFERPQIFRSPGQFKKGGHLASRWSPWMSLHWRKKKILASRLSFLVQYLVCILTANGTTYSQHKLSWEAWVHDRRGAVFWFIKEVLMLISAKQAQDEQQAKEKVLTTLNLLRSAANLIKLECAGCVHTNADCVMNWQAAPLNSGKKNVPQYAASLANLVYKHTTIVCRIEYRVWITRESIRLQKRSFLQWNPLSLIYVDHLAHRWSSDQKSLPFDSPLLSR